MASPSRPQGQQGNQQVFDDGTKTFFWRTHTITALVVISSVLLYVSLFDNNQYDTSYNIRRGALAVVVVFILIGVIHMPDGPFIRPHPALWRLALVITIVYVLLLIFTLFQNVDDARQFLKFYDPGLGIPLPERSYAEDCRIYNPDHPDGPFSGFLSSLWDKMDMFVASHFIGWYVKGLIMRDFWVLTAISVAFELLEYTLECQLPNFGECWWDHWILDALICNGLGIYCGILTCNYLAMKQYHWRGLWKIPTLKGKLKRAVGQFTPHSWTQFKWGYMESFQQFFYVVLMSIFWLLQELNVFYLKTVLWIPPNHTLNFYREVVYAFCGACAIQEMYDYLRSRDPNPRFGRYTWLIFVSIIIECLIEIKFGWEIITIPIPRYILVSWVVFLSVMLFWTFWHFTYPFRDWPVLGQFVRKLEKMIWKKKKVK